jgi:sugar phosphate isomerase/epimerase
VRLRIGYGTNGLAYHRLDDALALLADCGYDGVALTLDHHHLDPYAPDAALQTARLARRLDELGLAVVIETGARFLLDPRRKHQPSLVSEQGRDLRLDFYRRAIAIAGELGAEAVSLWSGAPAPGTSRRVAHDRLVDGMARVLALAEDRDVVLGFEPEPGMLVERFDEYERLAAALDDPPRLGVTLDLGHCLVMDEPVGETIRRAGPRLVNVHVEDMRREAHDHLDFGEGELDFPPALAALREIGYAGLVAVELSRHSHAADTVVPRAIRFLREAERLEAAVL